MRVRLHKSNTDRVPKWKKHASSSSNPSRTKYRDAAKLQLLSSLPTSQSTSMDIPSTSIKLPEVDRISQYSKTTARTTGTNASMIQVNPKVIQVMPSIVNMRRNGELLCVDFN